MKRVGIVGAGGMGKYHAQRLKLLSTLVGFYDIDSAMSEDAAKRFDCRAFASRDALFQAVDVVYVTTPTTAHAEIVQAAAAAGKDIFCEKPMARHLHECEAMVAACERSGSRLFIGQVVRFFPEFAKAKESLASGAIGKACVIRSTRGGSHPNKKENNWYADYVVSGGVIFDLAVHDLDYHRWCCGDVARVFAHGLVDAGLPLTDYALISLRFKSGAVGQIEASWAYPPGTFMTRLEIAGESGLIEFDSRKMAPLQVAVRADDTGDLPGVTIPESPLAPEDDPYYREDKHFLECLESGAEFLVQPRDGLEAVKTALAAIHSTRTGQPVTLDRFEEVQ